MGDSITAAFAVEGGIWEYRDESWSIGMGSGKLTMPNILAQWNPNVWGGSITDHFPETHKEPHDPSDDICNAAQSEAVVNDLAGEQVGYLISQMQNSPDGNFETDWKVITIWIGANDLCKSCEGENITAAAENYFTQLDGVINTIHQQVPRVFVNLVETMNLSRLGMLAQGSENCSFEHAFFTECYCVFKGTPDQWQIMDDATALFNAQLMALQNKWNMVDDQFAVVVQPFLQGTLIPDLSWVSTLDCFHPALKTHQMLAVNLFNSMTTPIAQKPLAADFNAQVNCPTADTLIYKV
jgi:phospholipase B1